MLTWFAEQTLMLQIVLGVSAFALGFFLLVLSYFKLRKFMELQTLKDLKVKDRVGLKIEFIKTAAQILGGAFFLFGLYFTWANLVVSQEKQITELYVKAIEQLGKQEMEVRLGGIYALERIAQGSKKDHWPIMEVLTAYVRGNAPWPPEDPEKARLKRPWAQEKLSPEVYYNLPWDLREKSNKIDPDIRAILVVIGSRKRTYKKGEPYRLDLRRTDLRGYEIYLAHLEGANLEEAHLDWAVLNESYLKLAYLKEAHLEGASFFRADLTGAIMENADLKKANLTGTILCDADLTRADLREAKGLTQEQIDDAYCDETTKLPPNLKPSGKKKPAP